LTKHWHYLLLLIVLLILNVPAQAIGSTVGGVAGEMIVAAAFGIGFIATIVMWIVFASTKKKVVHQKVDEEK